MRKITIVMCFLSLATAATAQQASSASSKPQTDELGWISSMSFEGNVSSDQRVLDLNSSVGYNFTKNWGADLGVPFEFVSTSASTSTTGTGKSTSSTSALNSIGNVFADLRFSAKGDALNYSSSLTATAPTGSEVHGVSTGRGTLGWNNRLEHDFGRFTPFIEAGFGNSVMDTKLYHRPFTTLGFVSQYNGGTTFDLGHDFSVGASLYDVLPGGNQILYSKIVGKGGAAKGNGNHGRAYELTNETKGTSTLTRDNGDSAWVEYTPGVLDFQVGYTHSVHYAFNTFAFSAGVDLGKLMRRGGY